MRNKPGRENLLGFFYCSHIGAQTGRNRFTGGESPILLSAGLFSLLVGVRSQLIRKAVFALALTIKQEKFCIEYAKSGNARQAYEKAGYSCSKESTVDVNACRLLKNDKVKERLAELTEEVKDASIADIKEMQEKLTEIIRQQAEEEVIVVLSKGDFMQEAQKMMKKPAIKEVISAIEKLGKMQGAFTDNVNVNGVVPVVIAGDDELAD
jgi:phage terminase small subunit